MIIHNTSILLLIIGMLNGCGYTLLKEEDSKNHSDSSTSLIVQESKIGLSLMNALSDYERTKRDSLSKTDPYKSFLIHELSGVDEFGRVRLSLRTNWTGTEVEDSLVAVRAFTENKTRYPNGKGRYVVWVAPEVVRRITTWSLIEIIDIIQRTGFTREGN
jgi:hypothetical protein